MEPKKKIGFFDKIKQGFNKWKNSYVEFDLSGAEPKIIPQKPTPAWTPPQPQISTQLQPTIAKSQPTPQPIVEQTPEPSPTPMLARNQSLSKFTVTPQVETAIRNAATEHKLAGPEILGDIAIQESSMDPTNSAERGGFANSTSKGLYMFNDPTWQTVQNYKNMAGSSLRLENDDRFDPNTSAKAAAYLIANGQLGRWYPSAAVWAPNYTWEELQPYLTQTTDPEALATIKYYAKK
jgi:hypothetical protein